MSKYRRKMQDLVNRADLTAGIYLAVKKNSFYSQVRNRVFFQEFKRVRESTVNPVVHVVSNLLPNQTAL